MTDTPHNGNGRELPAPTFAIEPVEARDHTAEQVHEALVALACNGGNASRTSRELDGRGINVCKDTLLAWRDKYPNRYQAIQERVVLRVEDGLVHVYREVARNAAEGSREAVELERERIAAGSVKDAAKTAQQLALASAIGTDKFLTLTGRPDRIVANPDAANTLRTIAARFAGVVIDTTAEEMPPLAVLADTTDEGNADK